MMTKGFLLVFVFFGAYVTAAEMPLVNSNTPRAPLTPGRGKSPAASLTRGERKDLVQEFRGLLALGQRRYTFSQWKGRSMADCYANERPSDPWKQKCEIITGQGNGFYYFYPGPGTDPVLERVEVFLQTSDESLMDDLHPTVRKLFGQKEKLLKESPGCQAYGMISHWNVEGDKADLYLDALASLNGTIHFVWTR